MKNTFSIMLLAVFTFVACTTQNPQDSAVEKTPVEIVQEDTLFDGLQDTVVHIAGTCNNCKMNIEKAANAVPGVTQAIWTIESKELRIGWSDTVQVDSVIAAVEAAGYKRILSEE